jgi:hypothetical protein
LLAGGLKVSVVLILMFIAFGLFKAFKKRS